MVEDKWVQEVATVAQTVAYTITRNYKGFAEVDDVKQELLEWSLRRADKIQEWLSPDLPRQEYKLGVKRLAKTFNRMADRYCRKEKAKKLGYSIHDEAFYSPGLVEQLLPFAFNNNIETITAIYSNSFLINSLNFNLNFFKLLTTCFVFKPVISLIYR
jgi:N-glycosylase/DNA lyase